MFFISKNSLERWINIITMVTPKLWRSDRIYRDQDGKEGLIVHDLSTLSMYYLLKIN